MPAAVLPTEPNDESPASEISSARRASVPSRELRHLAAVLLIAQFVAMGVAFSTLSTAINWPASLNEPASVMLPLLREQSGAMLTGYGAYLLHALLLIPLAVVLRHSLPMAPVAGGIAMAFGVLAGFAKMLGIVRWLVLMPALATRYLDPAAGDAGRTAVAEVFEGMNAYAGGVGEILGVGLFAGLWTLLVAGALLRHGGAARWLGVLGIIAACSLLLTTLTVLGIESPLLLTLSNIGWQVWLFALAIHQIGAARVRQSR
jgi:hypothetical protein